MLARSYTVLGRFDEAIPAYARAAELEPNNADLLADYADAVAATQQTANNPQSIALIERALKADPKHFKALALAGSAAFDRGEYAGRDRALAEDRRPAAARQRARAARAGDDRRRARQARRQRRGAGGSASRRQRRRGARRGERRRSRRPAPASAAR